LPKVKHFDAVGIERFVHDVVNDLIHGGFDNSPYSAFKPADLQTILESFKIFISQSVSCGLTKEQMLADLASLGCAEDDSKFVVTAVLSRREEIRQKFSNSSVKLNTSYLVDFDWKVHVTLASDTVSQCREPLLLLSLRLGKNDDENFKELILELTRDDLDKLIGQLETVNDEVIKLKF